MTSKIIFTIRLSKRMSEIVMKVFLRGYLLKEKKKAIELKTQIDKIDTAIDAMVYELYELYGLSEEEIGIVKGS